MLKLGIGVVGVVEVIEVGVVVFSWGFGDRWGYGGLVMGHIFRELGGRRG